MKVTLRPDPELLEKTEEYSEEAKKFLTSLGLKDVEDWRMPVEVELVPEKETGTLVVKIFGMDTQIPEELTDSGELLYGISVLSEDIRTFCINGRSVSAKGSASLSDLTPLTSLTELTSLNLSQCDALSDLSGLASLTELTTLDLTFCEFLSDLAPLTSLTQLTILDLGGCYSLSNLAPLASLTELTSLNLQSCDFLSDISGLASLTALTKLNLSWCTSLSDLAPLASLTALTKLNLANCKSLSDLTPLASLTALTKLNLGWCESLTDLTPLTALARLTTLNLTSYPRLRSIKPLHFYPNLKNLDCSLPPAEVAEFLADLAIRRRDTELICERADAWLRELVMEATNNSQGGHVDSFATTLARAFCLLAEHEVTARFQAWMNEQPDLSPQPWSAWFRGTVAESGFNLFRNRAEQTPIPDLTPGAVGGIAAVVAGFGDEAHRIWGQKWLVTVDDHWSDRARDLLPAAPEICLANEKIGRRKAVQLWLERFTDPSDAAALDPVHEVLARWLLSISKLAEAEIRISQVSSPELRDPVLAEIVRAHFANKANKASRLLLTIESPEIREDLALELANDTEFTGNPENDHVLLVAAGNDPAAIARLLDTIAVHKPDSPMLEELRSALAPPETDTAPIREWRIAQIQKLKATL